MLYHTDKSTENFEMVTLTNINFALHRQTQSLMYLFLMCFFQFFEMKLVNNNNSVVIKLQPNIYCNI